MQSITLQALNGQKFSLALDGNQWDMQIKDTNGVIAVSLSRNGVPIMENQSCVPGERVIPCKYQEAGNFFFTTKDYEILDYTKFGITQFLFYASQAEIDAVRDQPDQIIKSTDFDPNGALPQSFAPKGYVLA